MERLLVMLLLTLATSACGRESQQSATAPAMTAPDNIVAAQGPVSKPPAVVPVPKDQAELDRMILAGYTPHGVHLHPPGVNECPLAQGGEAVM
jgi:hypothetical protein